MNELSVLELKEKIESGRDFTLLDVREPHELYISNLKIESIHIPLDDLSSRMDELDGSKEIIVMCRSGNSATTACKLLTEKGFKNVFNLKGGINEWAQKIDPSLPVY
jgi:rhodanese-related sulfurtransferase